MPPLNMVARDATVFALFVILTIWMTWPLALRLQTAIPDPGDVYVSTYVMAWDYHATFSRAPLFDLPIFHPARRALAFSEHLYGIALPLFPLYAAGLDPLTVYNVGVILAFAFSGYGAFVLCRLVTGSPLAAIAGGCFFAFVPYRFTQLVHISYTTAGWLALLFAAVVAYAQRPTRLRATLFGAAFFLNGLACLHWLVLGGTAIALAVPILAALDPEARRLRFWAAPAIAGAAAMLALLPFLLPYVAVRSLYHMERAPQDLERYSAHLGDWLIGGFHLLYAPFVNDGTVDAERWLSPGVVPLIIALLWAWSRVVPRISGDPVRRPMVLRSALVIVDGAIILLSALAYFRGVAVLRLRWDLPSRAVDLSGSPAVPAAIATLLLLADLLIRRRLPKAAGPHDRSALIVTLFAGAIAFVGSLGVNAPLHPLLFRFVSAFRGIRVPARWATIVYIALAVVVAAACAALIERKRGAVRLVTVAAVAVAILLEQHPVMRYYAATPRVPEVYRWVASTNLAGALFEIPFREDRSEYLSMRAAATHLRPMLNGRSSYEPADRDAIEQMLHASPVDAGLLGRLEALGTSLIVVHADALATRENDVREWLATNVTAGRLAFVRQFCAGDRGDSVYAVVKNRPATGLLRPGSSGECGGTLGRVEVPAANADVRGMLRIEGHASAPDGIRGVFARFGGGSVRIPLALAPPDASTRRVQFTGVIRERPAHLPRDTDLQIEMISGTGRHTLLDDAFLTWRDAAEIRWYDWQRPAVYELATRMRRPPQFGRAILSSNAPVNLIGRTLVRDNRRKSDGEFLRDAFSVLLECQPDPSAATRLGRSSRFDLVASIVSSDEFAKKHLVARP